MSLRIFLLSLLACVCLSGAEYDEKLAATDTSNPDELYALAVWCKENGLHRSYSKHLKEALKIDPNHYPSQTARGYVMYDGKWVHKSRVPGFKEPDETTTVGGTGATRRPAGPAPTADQINWDLSIPANPTPENGKFLAGMLKSQLI